MSDEQNISYFPNYDRMRRRGVIYDNTRVSLLKVGRSEQPGMRLMADLTKFCDLFVDSFEAGDELLAASDLYLRLKGEWKNGN